MDPDQPPWKPFHIVSLVILLILVAGGIAFMVAGQWTQSVSPSPSISLTSQTSPTISSAQSSFPVTTTSPSPSATASEANTTTAAPTLTKVSETIIDGGNLWLFPVPDGEDQIAVSTEQGGVINMGRLDLKNPSQRISWQQVASSADTGGQQIADHWHIFAHGAHWLVFSVQQANRSFLMKLDKNFNRLLLVPVADQDSLSEDEQTALGLPPKLDGPSGTMTIPTNDMYLVAEPDGVAVSHMLPGIGARIYRFTADGGLREKTIVGGDDYQHNNGSSAVQTSTGFTIYGSESLNVVAQGAIKEIITDQQWKPLAVKLLVDEDRVNAAMPTAVELPNGYRVVTFRAVAGTYPRGTLPPAPEPGQGLTDDSGAIVRYLLDANGKRVQREVLVDGHANRPHTVLVDNFLLTAWDANTDVMLRIDQVN